MLFRSNKQRLKDWYDSYREKRKEYNRLYNKKNKKRIKEYNRQKRIKDFKDPFKKFVFMIRSHAWRVVKQLSLGKKPTSTFKWVGCSSKELKSHFESLFVEGMSWDNYGKWHIDHIRPVSSFKPEEWKQINHYTNLQPLWAEDNFKKSNKIKIGRAHV